MDGPVADAGCCGLLKVLADETRLGVVQQLMHGPRHVGQLNRQLRVEISLLSHHLRVLREAGVVQAQRDGKAMLYRLGPAVRAEQGRGSLDLGCCVLTFRRRDDDRCESQTP